MTNRWRLLRDIPGLHLRLHGVCEWLESKCLVEEALFDFDYTFRLDSELSARYQTQKSYFAASVFRQVSMSFQLQNGLLYTMCVRTSARGAHGVARLMSDHSPP